MTLSADATKLLRTLRCCNGCGSLTRTLKVPA